jgi:hypothetical protein
VFSRNFFIDHLSAVSLLLLPNTHGNFTLEERKMFFTCGVKSLLFKEGILNEILEMLEMLFILFSFFVCRKIKREGGVIGLIFFAFPL